MSTSITQAQSVQPPVLPPTPQLVEGGIVAAIAFFIVKEAVGFFKSKDASEDKLTRTLIEDLRSDRSNQLRSQSEVLTQLQASHEKIAIAIERMSLATGDINTALQMSKRTETEILYALRQNHQLLLHNQQAIATLNEKFDRITSRSSNGHASRS